MCTPDGDIPTIAPSPSGYFPDLCQSQVTVADFVSELYVCCSNIWLVPLDSHVTCNGKNALLDVEWD